MPKAQYMRSYEKTDRTFPTLLAPNRTVKLGSPSKARVMVFSSAGRSKKPGNAEKVCVGVSCARSLASASSLLVSSSIFLDSVRERRVSEGCCGRICKQGGGYQTTCLHRCSLEQLGFDEMREIRTLARTPIISPMPKKLRLRTSVGMGMPRRRGMFERKSQCSWRVPPSPIVVYMLVRRDAGGESACVRGVGPERARTVLPLLFVVLRAMSPKDPREMREEMEGVLPRRRLRIWKDERSGAEEI